MFVDHISTQLSVIMTNVSGIIFFDRKFWIIKCKHSKTGICLAIYLGWLHSNILEQLQSTLMIVLLLSVIPQFHQDHRPFQSKYHYFCLNWIIEHSWIDRSDFAPENSTQLVLILHMRMFSSSTVIDLLSFPKFWWEDGTHLYQLVFFK